MELETIKARMEEDRIEYVALQFPNILGEIKEVFISKSRFNTDILEYGYSNRDMFQMFGEEVYLKPKLDTYQVIPWYVFTARFLSRLYLADDSMEFDMFSSLEKVVESLQDQIQFLIQPAIEYYIIENVNIDRITKDKGPAINLDTKEGRWNMNYHSQQENIFSSYPADFYIALRQQIVSNLQLFRYDVESHYHSYSPSQHKIVMDHMDPIRAAQSLLDIKYITRALGAATGTHITYIPYLFAGHKGNSLELRLVGDFVDNRDLKEEVRYFVAGILEHINSIMLFTNPTTNSYRRIQNEGFYRCYSRSYNPSTAVEINTRGKGEIRLLFPDSSAHPILGLTAILAAGYDGIKKKISLEYEVTTNPKLMSLKDLKEKRIDTLPHSLEGVLESFQSDRNYLKGFVSSSIINEYLNLKQQEIKDTKIYNSAHDYEKYL
ncbi:MAG: hypothetical protein QW336_00820 [Candidatus Anstonellales archaeon]